ncbi:MAG: Arc family DNA-binding protein [Chitinophagaceae bacterium]|nr:Arc family DNA-binding protein [Rubrivivax sp.]
MQVNLSIKAVPQALADRLRRRAERNHRSLQGELMAIIEQAVAEPAGDAAKAHAPLAADVEQGWKTIEDLVFERRQRPARHMEGLPLAVDIVRADRDSR